MMRFAQKLGKCRRGKSILKRLCGDVICVTDDWEKGKELCKNEEWSVP
jgi:hypothetical protein